MGNTRKSMADSCQCMAKTLQYCKVISLQLIKINGKKRGKKSVKAMSRNPQVNETTLGKVETVPKAGRT